MKTKTETFFIGSALTPEYQPRPMDPASVQTEYALTISAESPEQALAKQKSWHIIRNARHEIVDLLGTKEDRGDGVIIGHTICNSNCDCPKGLKASKTLIDSISDFLIQ